MTKVVVNKCYGGFGLSAQAVKRCAELKAITLYPEPFTIDGKPFGGGLMTYWTVPPTPDRKYNNDTVFHADDLKRDDPTLAQVVEELGKAASGDCAQLVVEEIPAGTLYRIQEYDGREWIETSGEVDWSIAQ